MYIVKIITRKEKYIICARSKIINIYSNLDSEVGEMDFPYYRKTIFYAKFNENRKLI